MNIRQYLSFFAVLGSILLLTACGSNSGSGGDKTATVTPADTPTAGITSCAQCHSSQNEDWLEGRHANSNLIPVGPHLADSSCGSCHNNLEDSFLMPDAYGETARDVVGCESCHGGGFLHRGLGDLPTPKPDAAVCLSCHATYDEETESYTPMYARSGHDAGAVGVYAYAESGHAGAPRDFSTRSGTVGCNRCHSDEGAKLYKHLNTIAGITDADGRGRGAMPLGIENLTPIQCRTCHDSHDTGGNSLLIDASYDDAGSVIVSSQYNTCNHCHAGNNEELNFHANHTDDSGLLDREIMDTHYDDPDTAELEGYIIRTAEDTACSDCHDVHGADLTINNQWALSGHGGEILKYKAEAGAASGYEPGTEEYAAAVIDADIPASAFVYRTGAWDPECQRCHTSTGASNYLDNPAGYDQDANVFPQTASAEMIYCWACHDNAGAGTMRDPGALTIDDYAYGASVEFPDSAASNVCIACHTGRAIGDSITNITDDGTDVAFVNSHYLTAGGILFATGGYEYAVEDYAVTAGDMHQNIGYGSEVLTGNADFDVPAFSDNYTSGPCATCHFSSDDGSHTLSPFTTHADPLEGEVLNDVCVTCHTSRGVGDAANAWYGKDFTEADFVYGEVAPHKGRMLAAQKALDLVLRANGIYFAPAHPYFFTVEGSTDRNDAVKDWTAAYGAAEWKNVMGAAFNLNLVAHDPAATAHNRRYARRLLYDSIDFMDDGIMNDSTQATLTAQDQDFTASALNYIGNRP